MKHQANGANPSTSSKNKHFTTPSSQNKLYWNMLFQIFFFAITSGSSSCMKYVCFMYVCYVLAVDGSCFSLLIKLYLESNCISIQK